jgi:hypothetical protein
MSTPDSDQELRNQVHALFGDHQAEEGGYQSCYDGKWLDMTNEVCAVADFIKADRLRTARKSELEGKLEVWKYLQKQEGNEDGYLEFDVSKVYSFIELIEATLATLKENTDEA